MIIQTTSDNEAHVEPSPLALDAGRAAVQAERAYWRGTPAPTTPWLAYAKRRSIFPALQQEMSAIEQITQAMLAQERAEWAQAGSSYACAVNLLSTAFSKWSWAIGMIASEIPFAGCSAEPEHRFALPPSLPLEMIEAISPYVLHIYESVDRVLNVWQDLLPRQVLCLTKTLQAATLPEATELPAQALVYWKRAYELEGSCHEALPFKEPRPC